MRILYALNSSLPHVGASRAFMQLLPMLQAKGVEPVVLVPDESGLYHDLQAMGVEILAIPSRDGTWSYLRNVKECMIFLPRTFMRRVMIRRAVNRLVKYLKAHPVDLVHTNVSVYDVAALAADHLEIPHVYHIREFADRGLGMYYFPCRRWYRNHHFHGPLHYTVCITKCIQKYHGLDTDTHSCVIYDPIVIPQNVKPYSGESEYFLFVGRVEPSKGLDVALQGYARYVHHTAHPIPLWIVGGDHGGRYSQMVHQYVKEQHLDEYVRFLGVQNDVLSFMAGARSLIVSSEYEGFGLCMAEAQSVGCLVVARCTTGSAEQMQNGQELTGREIALSYDTPQQLADHLHQVAILSPVAFNTMRSDALQSVRSYYDREQSAEKIIRFYQAILSK